MSEATDIAARAQRFTEAVRAFTPPAPSRHAKLMPYKDGIVELRQKGGSLRLIREMLAAINVAVGTDTIARFLADVNGEPTPKRSAKRLGRERAATPGPAQGRPAADAAHTATTPALPLAPASPTSAHGAATATPATPERPRTRGPRIADPSNL